MELVADQPELFESFPAIADRVHRKSFLREYVETTNREGALAPRPMIAAALGVSRQRVDELIQKGQLASVTVGGKIYVPVAALEVFLLDERRNGRPIKQPSHVALFASNFQRG